MEMDETQLEEEEEEVELLMSPESGDIDDLEYLGGDGDEDPDDGVVFFESPPASPTFYPQPSQHNQMEQEEPLDLPPNIDTDQLTSRPSFRKRILEESVRNPTPIVRTSTDSRPKPVTATSLKTRHAYLSALNLLRQEIADAKGPQFQIPREAKPNTAFMVLTSTHVANPSFDIEPPNPSNSTSAQEYNADAEQYDVAAAAAAMVSNIKLQVLRRLSSPPMSPFNLENSNKDAQVASSKGQPPSSTSGYQLLTPLNSNTFPNHSNPTSRAPSPNFLPESADMSAGNASNIFGLTVPTEPPQRKNSFGFISVSKPSSDPSINAGPTPKTSFGILKSSKGASDNNPHSAGPTPKSSFGILSASKTTNSPAPANTVPTTKSSFGVLKAGFNNSAVSAPQPSQGGLPRPVILSRDGMVVDANFQIHQQKQLQQHQQQQQQQQLRSHSPQPPFPPTQALLHSNSPQPPSQPASRSHSPQPPHLPPPVPSVLSKPEGGLTVGVPPPRGSSLPQKASVPPPSELSTVPMTFDNTPPVINQLPSQATITRTATPPLQPSETKLRNPPTRPAQPKLLNLESKFQLAKLCIEGSALYGETEHEVQQLKDEGFSHLTELSANGMADANYYLGKCFAEDGNYALAFPAFLRAAKSSCAEASFAAASCLEYGKGTPVSFLTAQYYYTASAEAGHILGMHRMAAALLNGEIGYEKDVYTGFKWLERVAETNDSSPLVSLALYQLSQLYEYGIPGILQTSPILALKFLQEAADRCHPSALTRLAEAYETGSLAPHLPKDIKKAAELYTQAAELRDFEAMFIMADFHLKGLTIMDCGCEAMVDIPQILMDHLIPDAPDESLVDTWNLPGLITLENSPPASALGTSPPSGREFSRPNEQTHVGPCRFTTLISRSPLKAFHYLSAIVESNRCPGKLHSDAQYALGYLYEHPLLLPTVQQDGIKAAALYEAAAMGGSLLARHRVAQMRAASAENEKLLFGGGVNGSSGRGVIGGGGEQPLQQQLGGNSIFRISEDDNAARAAFRKWASEGGLTDASGAGSFSTGAVGAPDLGGEERRFGIVKSRRVKKKEHEDFERKLEVAGMLNAPVLDLRAMGGEFKERRGFSGGQGDDKCSVM
ncbi:hypothetical protein HDU77_007692 [Chytriomyces hyalinus]|nr:hypothetical protein HDU77_007692 [Chytriomyces hyalinus]